MARFNEQSKVPNLPDQEGVRHFGDGIAGPIIATRVQGFDSGTLTYIDVAVDATGQLKTTGGAGGGGAVTVADGADVAQGTTTDAATASTTIGLLKAVKAAIQGVLNVDVSDRVGRLLGHVTIDNATLTVDTELPAAAALSDNVANPTAPMTGSGTMLWDSTLNAGAGGWSRAPGSVAAGMKVQSGQLPAALVGGRLSVDASGVAVPITDNAGSLTVDAPVGTPVFVRLSDGAAAIATLPVSLAAAVDVSDRAARLLGVVDKGKVWDGTNIAAVKAASALAVATDPAFVVQHAPQRADASTLCVTATGVSAAAVTLTLPIPGAGLFHYITSIQIVKFATALLVAAATPVLVTTTNIPGALVFSFSAAASAAGTDEVQALTPTTPLKSAAANTATTIVGPATTTTIWRLTVTYYTAP